MNRKIYKLLLIMCFTAVFHMPSVSLASSVSEYKIKAAFIYNFAKFTKWPDKTGDLRVCIYGKDPFGSKIDDLDGKQSNGRTIKIVRTQLIKDVRSCHIAFLNIIPPERRMFKWALRQIKGSNVLTVSDAANVTDFGVMIGLVIKNNKVAFNVNHSEAKSSDLVISSKLLRLAREVI